MPEFEGKKVLIFGLKRSGAASALALHALGAKVAVTDMKTSGELAEEINKLPGDIALFLGGHPDEALEGFSADLVVVSPGVPMNIPAIKKISETGIFLEVISELELGFRLFKSANPFADFYAITGTNGKSTTTALLHYILERSGRRALLAGNIGYALSGFFQDASFDKTPGNKIGPEDAEKEKTPVVVEVSSFQLEGVRQFKPRIAAILNLAPDHLDRYRDAKAYYEAKMRIFERQDEGDYLVLNADDPNTGLITRKLEKAEKKNAPKVICFGKGEEGKSFGPGLYSKGGSVHVNLPGMKLELIKANELGIRGAHNLENAMAAAGMALLAGVPVDALRKALMDFPGLPHRMEFVKEFDGVAYINDSKGTNPPAVLRSLESFGGNGKSLILIAGGRDKNGDFHSLRNEVEKTVKLLVLIGEASGKIASALEGATRVEHAKDLAEALSISRQAARPGDVVLLSPACASFDMFKDFEDRGFKFRQEVERF